METGKGGAIYNPQRVLKQLGFDYGAVIISGELATSTLLFTERGPWAKDWNKFWLA